jgi:hypothetical protein
MGHMEGLALEDWSATEPESFLDDYEEWLEAHRAAMERYMDAYCRVFGIPGKVLADCPLGGVGLDSGEIRRAGNSKKLTE